MPTTAALERLIFDLDPSHGIAIADTCHASTTIFDVDDPATGKTIATASDGTRPRRTPWSPSTSVTSWRQRSPGNVP